MRLNFSLLLVLSLFFTNQIISQTPPDEEKDFSTYTYVEQMPRFPGCEDMEGTAEEKKKCAETKMLKHIYSNLQYTEAALQANVEGMVVLSFVVDEEGKMQDQKIVRDLGHGLGDEAMRVLNSFPTWIPGSAAGKKAKVQIRLPFRFKIQPQEKEFEAVVHEKLTPELIHSLRKSYSGLQYIFCADFAGEIVSKKELAFFADDKIDPENICGYLFKISNLSLAYTEGDSINKTLVSADGQVTEEMRNLLKNVQPGASLVFKFTASRDDERNNVTKTLIIKQE